MTGFDIVVPFLRPIEHLILDPDISEIMVNGSGRIFIERAGCMEEITGCAIEERMLQVAVKNIARRLGDEISDERPLLDSRLPDGSRVAAMFPPCSIGGSTFTVRKFAAKRYGPEELVTIGTITAEVLARLKHAILARKNILISGGTSTGKTTMLNALATFVEPRDRIFVIEDTAELHLEQPNLVRSEARREQMGVPAVSIRDLLKHALRHRPDRIILGEVRGAEAFDLLQALNTGHSGSLCTIHANSATRAVARLGTCVLQADADLPYRAIRAEIADCINLLIHIERRNGKRYVSELVEITGYDPDKDRFEFQEHFHASR